MNMINKNTNKVKKTFQKIQQLLLTYTNYLYLTFNYLI